MTATPAPPLHTDRPALRGERALVLGGGGSTGNAWLLGVLAGLADGGTDVVAGADLLVGTSAGATAAAQVCGAGLAELYEATLVPPPAAMTVRGGTRPAVGAHLQRLHDLIASAEDAADLRKRLGAAALALDATAGEDGSARWRAVVAARLPRHDWPDRDLLLTAVDASTGAPAVLHRGSGADLVDTVAASCSSRAAYRIGDRRFLDGGFRRNENADLATGYARVLVLSPLGGRSLTPPSWGQHLATQVEELRAGGSRVQTVLPASSAEHLLGANAMDLSLRPAAARAGHAQGLALAPEVASLWG